MSEQSRAGQAGPARPPASGAATGELGPGQLAELLGRQLARLAGDELALARAEAVAQARQFSMGGLGLLAAAFFGFPAWLALVAAAALALAQVLPGWAAALIAAGGLGVLAGGAALWAGRRLAGAGRPLPLTTESVRRDIQLIRDGAQR